MTDSPTFVDFNPTNNPDVQNIKQRTDELIAICRSIGDANVSPESKRRVALAVTNYEQAAMWAVKALFS